MQNVTWGEKLIKPCIKLIFNKNKKKWNLENMGKQGLMGVGGKRAA